MGDDTKKLSELSKDERVEIEKIIRYMGYEGEITDEVARAYAHKALTLVIPIIITLINLVVNALEGLQEAVKEHNIPLIQEGKNITPEFIKVDLSSYRNNVIANLNTQMIESNKLFNSLTL